MTTTFVYNVLGQLVAEYNDQAPPPETTGTSYVTADHLGCVRVITDGTQAVKKRYDYLPFGEEIPCSKAPETMPASASPAKNGTPNPGWITSALGTSRERRGGLQVLTRLLPTSMKEIPRVGIYTPMPEITRFDLWIATAGHIVR